MDGWIVGWISYCVGGSPKMDEHAVPGLSHGMKLSSNLTDDRSATITAIAAITNAKK